MNILSADTKTITIDGAVFNVSDILANVTPRKPLKLRVDGGYLDLMTEDGNIEKVLGYFSATEGTFTLYSEVGEVTAYAPSLYTGDKNPCVSVKVV